MRKLLKGALFLLGTLSVTLLAGSSRANAAGNATMLPDQSIQVNYKNEEMVVTGGKNTVIYYSDNANATIWEEVDVRADGKAVFDISWIKPGVTTRIYIKGDKDTLVTARYINAQEKLSAEFVGDISAADVVDVEMWKTVYEQYPAFTCETGYILFFTKNGGAETAYFDVENIEWKKGNSGNWRDFKELNLGEMNAKGASLYFRVKAVNDEETADGISGTRYSSDAKVFLQKKAIAPMVSVNNAAMTLSIRNGMEYSLNEEDWYLVPVYSKTATGDDISVRAEDYDILPTTNRHINALAIPFLLDTDANKKIDATLVTDNPGKYRVEKNDAGAIAGIYVYVRTAAGQRKSASKTERVLIPFATADPDIANDIELVYQNTKSGNSGIIITNKTGATDGVDYQYAIVDDPDTMSWEEFSELKWNTLKMAKTVKVSSSKALTGNYVIFRVAATGKKELPSAYEKYPYQILYDKVTYAAISSTSLYPGGVISAVTSNNAISGEITYTWERSDTATGKYTKITSGTGYAASQYTIKESDVGYYIRVTISNESQTGEKASVTSKNSGKIIKDPTVAKPTPTPTPAP
ncbi:MAG: hypothetical protein PUC73_08360 [Lachnospiraceae bacterium]|nr:hypothetical protein [Lachnospiraceae bacterium]